MRWLHLTDIHIGGPSQTQRVALKGQIAAIRTFAGPRPFDVVTFTGDLAFSGKVAEYDALDVQLIGALRNEQCCRNATLISVPGNHDVDCDSALPCTWSALDAKRQRRWFSNDEDGQQVRSPRAQAFTAYAQYIKKAGIQGLDPLLQCSSTTLVLQGDRKIAFVGLNTALFSDVGRSDQHDTPAPVLALKDELQKLEADTFPIVLGHHPIAWFSHITQEPFRTALLEANAFYAHGHMHQLRVGHSIKGLEYIGFGAVYANSPDAKADAYYENSFAICELDDHLHVQVVTWDGVNGRWMASTRLTADFSVPSQILQGGYRFDIPARRNARSQHAQQPDALRRGLRPSTIFGLGILQPEAWWQILCRLGEVDGTDMPPPRTATPGQVEFFVPTAHTVRLLKCISGQGHILSGRELEAENTRLDTEEHQAVTIISLGGADDSARQLANRLSRKKGFKLMCNEDLANAMAIRLTGPAQHHLDGMSARDGTVAYVLSEQSLDLLVWDGTQSSWFYVVQEHGGFAAESSNVVQRIRESHAALSRAAYRPPGSRSSPPSGASLAPEFRRDEYLASCRAEFDEIKYAPLAALGFKFPKARLLEIYVPATAELSEESSISEQLRHALDDFVDNMDLDEAARAHVRAQLSAKYLRSSRPGGSTRAFYQERRNVLVQGDPGSGKTCFVKNEVLSYCVPPEEGASWYALHTPVFVPLVEAAPLLTEDDQLLRVCATVTARRGLPLALGQLEFLVASGRAAFFFDGLDEIPSVELRARVMRAIGGALETMTALGNRIVVTSRPAALESLDVPKGLVPLHLRHLSTAEIRVLAGNILSMHLTDEGERVGFVPPETRDRGIIDKLLTDCETKPGIGRLARNPLLLTLLVMIYANSGAPAAKKHRIYAQAVQTLVSVRNRAAGSPVLSESDLRRRLGSLALSIYEGIASEIPTRETVVRLLAESLKQEGSTNPDADAFLQRVAESTGLLTIHAVAGDPSAATITFMHHSFLEYYAAVGLVASRERSTLPMLVETRRWREVVSLAAGLIGDQADVAPLVEELLIARKAGDEVTQAHLLFAFDCALECDVPPEKAQRALAAAVEESMRRGPGRVDAGFRSDLAERMARLWEATGSAAIGSCLSEGLRSSDPMIAAAYADLVGAMSTHGPLPTGVIPMMCALAARNDAAVRVALFGAVGKCAEVRSAVVLQALQEGFRQSFSVKYAAIRAIEDTPALAAHFVGALTEAVDDPQAPIAAAAAQVLLESGVDVTSADAPRRLLVEKCLRRWEHMAEPAAASRLALKAKREDVDDMLSSPAEEQRVLAIRLLPWLERQEPYVHERLFEVLQVGRSSAEIVAALNSLRLSPGALALCTSRDIDLLIELGQSNTKSRDVRIAAVRALSGLAAEERVVSSLLERCRNTKNAEYRECLRALAVCAPKSERVLQYLKDSLRSGVIRATRGAFGNAARQQDLQLLIRLSGDLGIELGDSMAESLAALGESFKTPEPLRIQSIRTYIRAASINIRTLDRIVDWLTRRGPPFETVVAPLVPNVLHRARQRVESVRAIYPALGMLEQTLLSEWHRLRPDRARFIDDYTFRGLRAGVRDLRDLRSAFSEFARDQAEMASTSRRQETGVSTNAEQRLG